MSLGETVMRGTGAQVSADSSLLPVDAGASAGGLDKPSLFRSDAASGADELGRSEQAGFFAELLAHKQVETPFCLGVFGPAGAGKTHFLNHVLDAVDQVSGSADATGDASPFVPGVLTVRIDASTVSEAGDLLAGGVFEALVGSYPRLATETMHAGADPIRAAREAGEALNEARRRLDTERQSLDALGGREVRLTDAVLFEAAGSRVDAYARRNRSRIERTLRLFGFNSADPVTTYKELVREAAEADGSLPRLGIGLRSLWAYQGQTRLIVSAIIFALIAWGASALRGDQNAWLNQIREMGERATPVADWAQAHAHWLGPIHTVALVLAIACLVWNVVRAARFLLPIFKGVSLLRHDVGTKRRDINGLLAHQTRRVDDLAADVETAATQAEEAERRASAHKAAGLQDVRLPQGGGRMGTGAGDPVTAFFKSLGNAVTSTGSTKSEGRERVAPRRIIVMIDGLDQLADATAATVLKTAHRLLGQGFVTVVAADRTALLAGFAEADPALATAQLDRCVQLSYSFGASDADEAARSRLAMHLIEGGSNTTEGGTGGPDPRRSVLDLPWRAREAETVAALAPFAGGGPRAVKHYVNLYRVARADPRMRDAPAPVFTALALALALDKHGFPEDLAALQETSHWETPRDLTLLRKALAAAQSASGEPVELTQAQRGFDIARRYSARV